MSVHYSTLSWDIMHFAPILTHSEREVTQEHTAHLIGFSPSLRAVPKYSCNIIYSAPKNMRTKLREPPCPHPTPPLESMRCQRLKTDEQRLLKINHGDQRYSGSGCRLCMVKEISAAKKPREPLKISTVCSRWTARGSESARVVKNGRVTVHTVY